VPNEELWYMIRDLQRQVEHLEGRLAALENTVGDHGSQLDQLDIRTSEGG
jgi:hypothetical protein